MSCEITPINTLNISLYDLSLRDPWNNAAIQDIIRHTDVAELFENFYGIRRKKEFLARLYAYMSPDKTYHAGLSVGLRSNNTMEGLADWILNTYPGPKPGINNKVSGVNGF